MNLHFNTWVTSQTRQWKDRFTRWCHRFNWKMWPAAVLLSGLPFVVPAATLTGTMFLDENQNGVFDSGERKGVNLTIYLANSNGQFTTQSDANGNYWITSLNSGIAQVWVDLPAGWKQTAPVKSDGGMVAFHTVNIPGGDQSVAVNFGLLPPRESVACVDFNADNSITVCDNEYSMQITPKSTNTAEVPMAITEVKKDSNYLGNNGTANVVVSPRTGARSGLRSNDETMTFITGKDFTGTGTASTLDFTPDGNGGYSIVDHDSPTTQIALHADGSYTVADQAQFPGAVAEVRTDGTQLVTHQEFPGMTLKVDREGSQTVMDKAFPGMAAQMNQDGSYTVTDEEYPGLSDTVYADGRHEVKDAESGMTIKIDAQGNYLLVDQDGTCYVNPPLHLRGFWSNVFKAVKGFVNKVAGFVSKVAGFIGKVANFVGKVAEVVAKVASVVSKVATFLVPFMPFACQFLCTIAAFADKVAFWSGKVATYAKKVADIANKVQKGADQVVVWTKSRLAGAIRGRGEVMRSPSETANCTKLPLVALQGVAAEFVNSQQVKVRWQTLVEFGNAGFNVYRAQKDADGKFVDIVKVNSSLVPSKDNGLGKNTYSYLDDTLEAGKTYYYGLESVDTEGNVTGYEDLVVAAEKPLLVTLGEFLAIPSGNSILVQWETLSEADSLGFNLWRAKAPADGQCTSRQVADYTEVTKLNDQPLVAKGAFMRGASYSYKDHQVVAKTTYCYGLEEKNWEGTSTFYWDWLVSAAAR